MEKIDAPPVVSLQTNNYDAGYRACEQPTVLTIQEPIKSNLFLISIFFLRQVQVMTGVVYGVVLISFLAEDFVPWVLINCFIDSMGTLLGLSAGVRVTVLILCRATSLCFAIRSTHHQ
jgi:hypothetical protein